MNEPGVTLDDVREDCSAVNRLFADRWSTAPASYVFPRNQENHVELLREAGIHQWRSNPASWYWDTSRPTTMVTRCLRAADGFAPGPTAGCERPAARSAPRTSSDWRSRTRRGRSIGSASSATRPPPRR